MKDRNRAYPKWHIDEPFEVTTDLSSTALAAFVSQKQNHKEIFNAAAKEKQRDMKGTTIQSRED